MVLTVGDLYDLIGLEKGEVNVLEEYDILKYNGKTGCVYVFVWPPVHTLNLETDKNK